MKRTLYLSLFLLFLVISCSKSSSDYRASGSNTVVIRGYEVRDDVGRKLADIGNPDINLSYPPGTNTNATLVLFSFPNPASDEMYLLVGPTGGVNNAKARIWIVPAILQNQENETIAFPGGTLIAPLERPLLDTTFMIASSIHNFRIKGVQKGYFRIYVKSEGILLWDNIVFVQ